MISSIVLCMMWTLILSMNVVEITNDILWWWCTLEFSRWWTVIIRLLLYFWENSDCFCPTVSLNWKSYLPNHPVICHVVFYLYPAWNFLTLMPFLSALCMCIFAFWIFIFSCFKFVNCRLWWLSGIVHLNCSLDQSITQVPLVRPIGTLPLGFCWVKLKNSSHVNDI